MRLDVLCVHVGKVVSGKVPYRYSVWHGVVSLILLCEALPLELCLDCTGLRLSVL